MTTFKLLSAGLVFVLARAGIQAQVVNHEIRRLDGERIAAEDAEARAAKILTDNHVTGAQIAVLNDGRLVWTAGFGYRNRDRRLFMTPDTTTWAASITKSVFATYVIQLAQDKKLNLDMSITKLLDKPLDTYPDYRDSASEIVRDPRFAAVTPRMLLSHTSGLANFATLELDKKMHLHFDPGTHFAYSGEGLNLLQFILEQREHQPLEAMMQNAIFDPLHMTHTSMVWNPAFASNVADRYDADEKFLSQTRRDHARGAGSMTTSVQDLSLFLMNLLYEPPGKKDPKHPSLPVPVHPLLWPGTLRTMLKPVIRIDTLHQFPTLDTAKGTEAPAVGLAYGLGWGLLTKTRFGPAFFKEGHGDGAQNYLICFTRHRDCIIILTNSDNGELAFKPLLEDIFGDTVTPWVWENYTPDGIRASRANP